MTSKKNGSPTIVTRSRPLSIQHAKELQHFGTMARLPIALEASACATSVENLNQVLADSMTLRDLYKKHHWQVGGPTFYQLSRLLHGHEIVLKEARAMARQAAVVGDDGTNDLLVSDVIRTNEMHVWFLSEHLVDTPLVRSE